MPVIARVRRLLRRRRPVNRPRCPGCGRPVGSFGDVCAVCTSAVERDHGG